MGTTTSRTAPPTPRTIHITHPPPHTPPLPGYVPENNYTLEYTLLTGHHTVQDLLGLTQQHGSPAGPGVVGVRRENLQGSGGGMLSMDTLLLDGDRLEVVVGEV